MKSVNAAFEIRARRFVGHKMCAQVYTDSEPIRGEQKMKAPGKREQRKETGLCS